jgi:hypothetical protein
MKTSAKMALAVLFLALLVLLAWKFFPPTQNSPSPAPAVNSQPPAAVAVPKLAPATPAPASTTAPPPDRAALSAAGGSLDPLSTTYDHQHAIFDFGQVILTPGVPVRLNLPSGQPTTMTATVSSDGQMQVDVDIQHAPADGPGVLSHGVFFGAASGLAQVSQETPDFRLTFSAKLAGH